MWEKFYNLSSQDDFRKQWCDFIEAKSGCNSSPVFYMFITKTIFEQIIKFQFPIVSRGLSSRGVTQPSLDYYEKNALRYCGGYIVQSLVKQVRSSSLVNKNDLVCCLQDLVEG